MIVAILIIGVAFGWLTYETKYFTIRLPYGNALQSNSGGIKAEGNSKSLTDVEPTQPNINFQPSQFESLDIPEMNGNINIICVRE